MSKIQPNLNRLTRKRKTGNKGSLESAIARLSIGAEKTYGIPPAGGGSGGIASPIVEDSREYYATQTITSSDGMFEMDWSPVKKIFFTDSAGNSVEMDLDEPA